MIKPSRYELWRLRENQRNGNLYPTHGLGPIAQIMDINRGDKMEYLVSVASNDFMLTPRAHALATTDPDFRKFVGKTFRGNMNTTTIKPPKAKTIMLQHDVSSPRPYSRIHLVSGTKGIAQKYPLEGKERTRTHFAESRVDFGRGIQGFGTKVPTRNREAHRRAGQKGRGATAVWIS